MSVQSAVGMDWGRAVMILLLVASLVASLMVGASVMDRVSGYDQQRNLSAALDSTGTPAP